MATTKKNPSGSTETIKDPKANTKTTGLRDKGNMEITTATVQREVTTDIMINTITTSMRTINGLLKAININPGNQVSSINKPARTTPTQHTTDEN